MLKTKKITPYKPQPYKDGHKVLKTYETPFTDKIGNKAIITKCDFLDKKNKLNEGYILRVKWLPEELKFTGSRKKEFIDKFWTPNESFYFTYYDGYLIYFFEFEGKTYLSYHWDECDHSMTYMVFQLKENIEIPTSEEESLPYGHDFESIISYLVDSNSVEDFIAVKSFRYQDEKVVEGNKARIIFNTLFKKYCNREIEYITD